MVEKGLPSRTYASDMSDDDLDGGVVFQGAMAPVTAFLSDELVTLGSGATLREVAAALSQQTVGLVVVGTAEQVDGVISERDLVRAAAEGADLDGTTAGEWASDRLVWVDVEATVGDVAAQMVEGYLRHVLVGDGERLVGVVSIRDVVAAFTAM